MSDMPRFTIIDGQEYPDPDGHWVFVNDANAAVAAAEQRVTSDFAKYLRHMVDDDKFAAGVKAAREAVAAVACGPQGSSNRFWRDRVIAAIDALEKP